MKAVLKFWNIKSNVKICCRIKYDRRKRSNHGKLVCHVSNQRCFKFSVLFVMFSKLLILKSDPRPPKKKMFYLLQWEPFKNDEKCSSFHLKSSFRSQDNETFVLTFWSCRKNDLIWKIRLICKFMSHNLVNKLF